MNRWACHSLRNDLINYSWTNQPFNRSTRIKIDLFSDHVTFVDQSASSTDGYPVKTLSLKVPPVGLWPESKSPQWDSHGMDRSPRNFEMKPATGEDGRWSCDPISLVQGRRIDGWWRAFHPHDMTGHVRETQRSRMRTPRGVKFNRYANEVLDSIYSDGTAFTRCPSAHVRSATWKRIP